MNTFKNAEYTITTSLSDQSASIYIKIANNISYACYEGTFEKQAFRLSFELAGIYRLINKCLNAFTDGGGFKSPYTVTIELESTSIMRLIFNCMLEGILAVEFDLRLQQKFVSVDSIISSELEKQNQLIERLTKRLDSAEKMIELQNKKITELSQRLNTTENYITGIDCAIVAMGFNTGFLYRHYDKLSKEFKITETMEIFEPSLIQNLHKFPFIKKIVLFLGESTIYNYSLVSLLDDVELDHQPTAITHISIEGNRWDKMMNLSFIKSFPGLEYLTFARCNNGIIVKEAIQNLSSVKHKIKKITCDRVYNMNSTELQKFCETQNIQLEFC